MNIIVAIFASILKFAGQLLSSRAELQGCFCAMVDTHRKFREASGLLFKGHFLVVAYLLH